MMDPTLKRVYADMLNELKEQVVLYEEAGFECAWVDEHHFNFGFNISTNAVLAGAMLAAHTDRIRIGQTNVAGCWQPLRLAEDVSMLDHMSRGRVDVGLGRGVSPFDIANMNPELKGVWPDSTVRFNPNQHTASRAHFAKIVDILRKAWTEEFFSHEGSYYKYPHTGFSPGSSTLPDATAVNDVEIVKMRIGPRPYQKPHPPLWMLTTSDPSFTEVANLGLNGLIWIQLSRRLHQRLEVYSRVRTKAEEGQIIVGQDLGALKMVYVVPTYEEAKRDADQFFTPYYERSTRTRPATYWMDEGEEKAADGELT